MEIRDAIIAALDGQAVLFAGSGFSYGAKNCSNDDFKTGEKLKNLIAQKCNISLPTGYSLEFVSQRYKKKYDSESLVELLKNEFAVKSVEKWHDLLLKVHWKRIYTTNYDAVIETAAKNNSLVLTPVLPNMSTNITDSQRVCVHLNGYIDLLNASTLDNEFKLTDRSYNCDALDGKPWFEFFKSDLETAKAIFIVGYSMAFDIDIKRLLSSKAIMPKIFFINKLVPGSDEEEFLKDYGNVVYFNGKSGIEAFAKEVEGVSSTYIPSKIGTIFCSFCFEHLQSKRTIKASFTELSNLYKLGRYSDNLLYKDNLGCYKYVVLRKAVDIVLSHLFSNKKVFLATSDLGNGKTMFCQILRNELRTYDVNVFTFIKELPDIDSEIEAICRLTGKKNIVIIDDYQSKLHILRRFSEYGISNVVFIITARNSINAPNLRKLFNCLKLQESDYRPLYMNSLVPDEVSQLSNIICDENLSGYNVSTSNPSDVKDFINISCKARFSDLLLEGYQSSDIRERIRRTYFESDLNNNSVKLVAVLALMKATMNLELDFPDILDLLKIDYAMLSVTDSNFINEFFNVENNDLRIKSSIVSKELLYSVIGLTEVITTMQKLIFAADKNLTESNKNLIRNLLSYSHFISFIKKGGDCTEVIKFYDSVRNTIFCSFRNPFFWEQFASACIEVGDFPTATSCIITAFDKAAEIPGFVPFQIETIKAKCLLVELIDKLSNNEVHDSETAIQTLAEAHKRLLKYFDHPENNVYRVFKVGVLYATVYEILKDDFTDRQKSIFNEKKVEMLRKMKNYISIDSRISDMIVKLQACNFH